MLFRSKVAQAYVKAAPERVLWGSDWPHPSLGADAKPDDAALFDLLPDWAPEARTIRAPTAARRGCNSAALPLVPPLPASGARWSKRRGCCLKSRG